MGDNTPKKQNEESLSEAGVFPVIGWWVGCISFLNDPTVDPGYHVPNNHIEETRRH